MKATLAHLVDISSMSREELIEKLRAARDEDGYFTVSESDTPARVPDRSLSKEEQLIQAIEIFEVSLENVPRERTRVLVL